MCTELAAAARSAEEQFYSRVMLIANFATPLSGYCERRIRDRFDPRSVQANPLFATLPLEHETYGLQATMLTSIQNGD